MLARERDEDAPRLLTILCEAFVAVYTSLLCYSMAACDSHVLYRYSSSTHPFEMFLFRRYWHLKWLFRRLAGLKPTDEMWGLVFGGGTKQLVRVAASPSPLSQQYGSTESGISQPVSASSATATAVDIAQQRVRLHIKLLQGIGTPAAAGSGASSNTQSMAIPTQRFQRISDLNRIYFSSVHRGSASQSWRTKENVCNVSKRRFTNVQGGVCRPKTVSSCLSHDKTHFTARKFLHWLRFIQLRRGNLQMALAVWDWFSLNLIEQDDEEDAETDDDENADPWDDFGEDNKKSNILKKSRTNLSRITCPWIQ